MWFDEESIKDCFLNKTFDKKRGVQTVYSDLAIDTFFTFRHRKTITYYF